MVNSAELEFVELQEALLGRYSLDREIGRGGMGIVYLAHDVRLDRPVALKLLPPAYAAQAPLRDRFLREARTAAKLSHPNIVPIHSVEEAGDFVFFVMSYIEGETLGERIRNRGPVPPNEAARILREVSWALAYAHAQGVVHRDVKPDNILLEEGSGRALVTDFGIAQVGEAPGITASNEVLGTAEFMSPEQAAGDSVDERSDIYALGVVGHFMLSGNLPFTGETVAATLAKQITQPAPALATVAPEVPRQLGEAIDRCLEKDPEARFAGGERLAEALTGVLQMRKEVPVPIRVFAEQNRESTAAILSIAFWGIATLCMVGVLVVGGDSPPLGVTTFVTLFGAAMASTPLYLLTRMARRLLASGHTYEELVRALAAEIDLRRKELKSQYGGKSRLDRWAARAARWSGGVALGSVALLGWGPFVNDAFATATATVGLLGGAVCAVAGLTAAVRHQIAGAVGGESWFKLWKSAAGRLLFKVAGLGLGHVRIDGAFRPTEMAISLAADRLYDELPGDVKASFKDLPAVVRRLEADAEQMRARIEELTGTLQSLETDEMGSVAPPPAVADKREALAAELRETRAAAQKRLGQLVSALETIRLGLLRLHAGAGSVEGMTADLGAARELSDEIADAVEGQRQVEELLGPLKPLPELETPVP